MKKSIKKLPKAKKHRHTWISDEACFSCGAYTEFCKTEGCYAVKYCESNGEGIVDE